MGMVGQLPAAKVCLIKLACLDHRAHRPINNSDATAQHVLQLNDSVRRVNHGRCLGRPAYPSPWFFMRNADPVTILDRPKPSKFGRPPPPPPSPPPPPPPPPPP